MTDPTPLSPNRNYPLPHPDNPSARQDIQRIRDALNGIDGDVSEALSELMTQAEVDSTIADAIAGLIDSAPATLDTLNELAAALGQDQNFAATMTAKLADKANTTDAAEGAFDWIGDLSGTHIYTAAANAHAPAALRNGMKVRARVANANTSTTPTLNYAGYGNKAIVRFDLSPLSEGEMRAGSIVEFVYHSAPDKWLLMANGEVSRPNLLKNPAFERWSNGTSFTTIVNGAPLADEWELHASGSTTTISRIILTDAEREQISAGSHYALRVDNTGDADNGMGIRQYISQNVRALAGQTVTVSGWIRGTSSNMRVILQQYFGPEGGSTTEAPFYIDVISSTEFMFFSETVQIPSIDNTTVRDGNFLRIYLTNGANEEFWAEYAELKLEVGPRATPFQAERVELEPEPEPEIPPLVASANLSDLPDAAAARENMGVEIGVDVQPHDPKIGLEIFAGQLDGPLYSAPNILILLMHSPFEMAIDSFHHKLGGGAINATVQIEGVDVEGLAGIAISTTKSVDTATGANIVSVGDEIRLVISGATSADSDFSFQLNATRT